MRRLFQSSHGTRWWVGRSTRPRLVSAALPPAHHPPPGLASPPLASHPFPAPLQARAFAFLLPALLVLGFLLVLLRFPAARALAASLYRRCARLLCS